MQVAASTEIVPAARRPKIWIALADVCTGRDNNLNLMRFIAALAVLGSHSFILAGHPEPLFTNRSAGTIAVDVFFVSSGFLVARSMIGSDAARYARSRFLRIYPGLIVSVLVTVVAVGLFGTTMTALNFFTDRTTAKYVLANGSMLTRFVEFYLPGAFDTNPYASAVNGSLWTLPWEIRCYAVLGIGALVTGRSRRRAEARIAFIVFVGTAIVVARLALLKWQHPVDPLIEQCMRLVPTFFVGALAYVMRRRIRLSWPIAVLIIAGLALASRSFSAARFDSIYLLSAWYVVLVVAFVPGGRIRRFNRFDDISYGLYIYAFPVQQLVAAHISGVTVPQMFVLSSAVTVPLAVASWRFVEHPMLRHR